MIEITDLEKNFGDLKVLKRINLKISDGEIYGLVGVSGAGKSTLLRCINGLESYSSGSLKVNGIEVKDLDKKQKKTFQKNIGMIFQHFPMIDGRVKELAEIVGITDKLQEKPGNLSGGQKQRVAIARALSMNPGILLSDEATSALDPMTTQSILGLLKEINEKLGITIIIVTHQMEVVRQVCQKVSLLENGEIVASGDVEELFLRQPDALQSFLGRNNTYTVPEGTNIQILLQEKDSSRKILSKMARQLQIDYMVCGGKVEKYRDKNLGELVIHVSDEDSERVKKFLSEEDVIWHEYRQEED